MKEWEIFFKENAPENDDVMLYIRRHTYHCPYASFFKNDIYNKPRWDIRPPTSSWSLFPPNVVIALPSIRSRWDPIGTNMPFMQIDSGSGTGNNSVVSRYSRFKDAEIERLKLIQKKGLIHIMQRKVKQHGTKYATSSLNVEKLASLIFDIDLNFFAARLGEQIFLLIFSCYLKLES